MNDMTGIRDIDLFDKSTSQVKDYSIELNEETEEIKNQFEQLKACLDSNDLRFYADDFGQEIEQLDNVNLKVEHYHKTMVSVSEGYKSQEQSVADSTNLYLNSL